MTDLLFFGTKKDIIENIEKFEMNETVKYCKFTSYYNKNDLEIFDSIKNIPNIGLNFSGDNQTNAFLIIKDEKDINIQKVKQFDGRTQFFLSQETTRPSIVFRFGGIYQQKCIVAGQVNTILNDTVSQTLLKQFCKYLKKGFIKNRSYFIGPEAYKQKDSLRFVTMGYDQPIEYDLKVE